MNILIMKIWTIWFNQRLLSQIELPYIDGPQLVNVYDINLSYEIKNASNGSFVVNSSKVKIEKGG